jgi:hypothetical protein
MLPESPTFYKVTCVISMCCMGMLVVLLVCVQPHQSIRFKEYRGQQLRATHHGRNKQFRDRDFSDGSDSDNTDRYDRRYRRENSRGFVSRRDVSGKSDAELVQEILNHNSMLARAMECKLRYTAVYNINSILHQSIHCAISFVCANEYFGFLRLCNRTTKPNASNFTIPFTRVLQMQPSDAHKRVHNRSRPGMLFMWPRGI